MIKSTRNGYCEHVQSIKNLSACVENSGELGWVVGCSLGGERWDEKEEEGETEEESVGKGGAYIMAFTDGLTDGIYPSEIPSVTVPRHCTAISV
jgi:fructose/tagatose bisphosphate aldolase